MFTIITASMEQLSPLKTDRKCVLSDYIKVALRVSLSKGKLDEQAENIDTILKTVDTMQNEECKLDDIFKSNSHLLCLILHQYPLDIRMISLSVTAMRMTIG